MTDDSGRTVLVTGGAGFFGGVLVPDLIKAGWKVVSIDREPHWYDDPALIAVRGDIRDEKLINRLFSEHSFAGVVHAAAVLAHGKVDKDDLWGSNVDGTRIVATSAARHGVPRLVFISSNCLWAENVGRPIVETDVPAPIEIYGRSKWEGEKIIQGLEAELPAVMIRTPTIIDEGRLGLLAILFEFIREGKKVWTVGGGKNVYQFVYAHDLAEACMLGLESGCGVYNVGSEDVPSIHDVYQYVCTTAGSTSRVAALPKAPALLAMRLASALRLSPLGPYHYRMIAEDFVFDTTKIRNELGWKPTVTNGQMLYRAYQHYAANVDEINSRTDVSAHRKATDMGPAIRFLKWLS
jgi:nucleoside-diphosphate-sugar epimerase